jgi:hypothetical protein
MLSIDHRDPALLGYVCRVPNLDDQTIAKGENLESICAPCRNPKHVATRRLEEGGYAPGEPSTCSRVTLYTQQQTTICIFLTAYTSAGEQALPHWILRASAYRYDTTHNHGGCH